jgi:hypothetical protein
MQSQDIILIIISIFQHLLSSLIVFISVASIFGNMRLSALIVLLGAASCTLGAALPAKTTPTAKSVVKTSGTAKALAKAPATTTGKALASATQSADNAPIKSLPFDCRSSLVSLIFPYSI